MSRPCGDCIGAIVEGHVPGFTPPDVAGQVVAYVSFAKAGDPYFRVEPSGQEVIAIPLIEGTRQGGVPCSTLTEAFAELEKLTQGLLAEGWIEVELDALGDPDY